MPIDSMVPVGAAFVAAASTLLATHLSARAQLRRARLDHEHQLGNDGRRQRSEAHVSHATQALNKMEQAHALLAKLRDETTRTASYIGWSRNMTTAVYHEHYLVTLRDYHSSRALVSTWFPEVHEDVVSFGAVANNFWGRQQHLLYLNEKQEAARTLEDEEATREALNAIGEVEQAAAQVVRRIEFALLGVAERLNAAAKLDRT